MLPVAKRLRGLVERIQPRPAEVNRAGMRFLRIRSRLSRSFVVARTIAIGSHSKGTAVTRISDVDILALLRRREAKWGGSLVSSDTFLRRVREDLAERYPQTSIRRDAQAIVVGFGQGEYSVDVVPAIYYKAAPNGYPIYRIPDGEGDWMTTAPGLHAAYFKGRDERSGGRLKHVVQMIKLWAQARATPVPLSSFHLEIVLAASGLMSGTVPYSRGLALSFGLLNLRSGAAIRDPSGVSGLIPAASSETKRESLERSLAFASEHAIAAHAAERVGDAVEALRQWRIVFGSYLPSS